jgi:inorganic pyrophosphatase
MAYKDLSVGKNPPHEVNALIEIPRGSNVKYEFDKASGFLAVDRLVASPLMPYPGNYGFIPHTLSEDGDPLDVILYDTPPQIAPSLIAVRAVAVLIMEDEHGRDEKIIAVPVDSVSPAYSWVKDKNDIPQADRDAYEYFFQHYKDLAGQDKRSKVFGWGDAAEARRIITKSIERAQPPGPAQGYYEPIGKPSDPGP